LSQRLESLLTETQEKLTTRIDEADPEQRGDGSRSTADTLVERVAQYLDAESDG
jgi:hypothetical protein